MTVGDGKIRRHKRPGAISREVSAQGGAVAVEKHGQCDARNLPRAICDASTDVVDAAPAAHRRFAAAGYFSSDAKGNRFAAVIRDQHVRGQGPSVEAAAS